MTHTDKIQIPIINKSGYPLPQYATEASAGLDLYAHLSESITLAPLERRAIPTGIFIALPRGYEVQIRPRSGWALKYGLTVLNTPGTIDADYRGEICVILANVSNESFTIQPGDRICQMVIARHATAEWVPADTLDETDRGAGGFGHTGTR